MRRFRTCPIRGRGSVVAPADGGGLLLELPDGGVDEHVEAAEGLAVRLGRRRRRRHAAAVQLVRAAVHWACLRGRERRVRENVAVLGFEKTPEVIMV